jgi:hypothetical protein
MCLRRAPEKYIAGAALDRADLKNVSPPNTNRSCNLWVKQVCSDLELTAA